MTQTSLAASSRPADSSKRWLALDLFRALAIISMIQGHVFTALLAPAAYVGDWVRWHRLIHGLTAPMFLIGAGLAYGLVSLRSPHEAWSGAVNGRVVKRGLTLIALGFALQVPKVPLSVLLARRDLLEVAVRIGPLQLVGATLVAAEALRMLARSRRRFVLSAALVGVVTSVVAPFVWKVRVSQGGAFALGSWLDGHAGSLFPWFPWAAFFFIGVGVCELRARVTAPDSSQRLFSVGLLAAGALMAGTCYALYVQGIVFRSVYGNHELWHTNPLYVVFRAGLVLAWLGVLGVSEQMVARTFRALPWLGHVASTLARHSLVAYVAHLLLLFGTPFTYGLVRAGRTPELTQAGAAFTLVLLVTAAVCWFWDRYVTTAVLARATVSLARRVLSACGLEVDRVRKRKGLDVAAE